MMNQKDIDLYNKGIDAEAMHSMNVLLSRVAWISTEEAYTFRYLRYQLGFDFGEVYKIAYRMKRYSILRDKGAGRGWKVKEGRLTKNANNNSSGPPRKESRWFTGYWEDAGGMDRMADRVADLRANHQANSTADQFASTLKIRT